MPYYRCVECDLTVYSAAGYSGRRACPDCGADLDAAKPVFVADTGASDLRRHVPKPDAADAAPGDWALRRKLARAGLAADVKPLASDGTSG